MRSSDMPGGSGPSVSNNNSAALLGDLGSLGNARVTGVIWQLRVMDAALHPAQRLCKPPNFRLMIDVGQCRWADVRVISRRRSSRQRPRVWRTHEVRSILFLPPPTASLDLYEAGHEHLGAHDRASGPVDAVVHGATSWSI